MGDKKFYRLIKRIGDVIGGAAGCMITGVLFLVIGPMICHASPGPVFFSQMRVGKDGKPFKLYKFRSMCLDAERQRQALWERNEMTGPIFKITDDPRVIPGIGEFIRKTHIDEFPQFWNVLKGEMSIVGTRPPLIDEWEQYDAFGRARLAIKPGITGLWQVSGQCEVKDFYEILLFDIEYIRRQSVWLDARIILLTVQNLFAVRIRDRAKDGSGNQAKNRTENRQEGRLSIAMFGQRFLDDPSAGGVEKVVFELSVRMAARGHRVTCFNRTYPGAARTETIAESHEATMECRKKTMECRKNAMKCRENAMKCHGIHVKTVPTIHRKGLGAFSSACFAAFASALGKFDVVHIHAEGPAATCWFPKLFGKRVIVTIHGLDWQRQKWSHGLGGRCIQFGERCAVKYADEIIVLSERIQKYFMDRYGRETVLIPNGADFPQPREADRIQKRFGLEKDRYILYLSRIVPEKRVDLLIDAFRRVTTDKRLVISGGGSDTDDYLNELHKKADGDERILFTGIVRGSVLEELYSNAYVYVLPSDLEGMPLSLIEAMSYGNCCIVSDIAECTEVIEDRAVTFRKGDGADLEKKLQMLCEDAALVQAYREGAADFICGKYSWDETADQTLQLYRRQAL